MDKETRIRKRQSYSMWLDIYNSYKEKKLNHEKIEFLLEQIHNHLDGNFMYGQHQKSVWSKESLGLVLRDMKDGQVDPLDDDDSNRQPHRRGLVKLR